MPENDRKQKEDAVKESQAGNDAHKKRDFDAAIKHYSKAIELDDEDILYIIDRSAVYFDMKKYNECIDDCNRAVERGWNLNSDGELITKAWTRKGLAYLQLAECAKDYDRAIDALDKACKMHENQDTLDKLECAKRAKEDLEQKECLSAADRERELGPEGHPEPEFAQIPENDRDMKKRKEDAVKESQAGNDAHKKKEFDAAIKHYSKAIELDAEDILYIIDRSAVYFDMKKYNECIDDCDRAVERGQNSNLDDELIAKAWSRKGLAYLQLAECAKDYDPAIDAFDKACKMHENQDTSHKLECARRAKEDLEQKVRLSAARERELGNKCYSNEQYQKAVEHYTEAIKLNPSEKKVLIDFEQNSSDAQEHVKNSLVLEKLQKLLAAGLL